MDTMTRRICNSTRTSMFRRFRPSFVPSILRARKRIFLAFDEGVAKSVGFLDSKRILLRNVGLVNLSNSRALFRYYPSINSGKDAQTLHNGITCCNKSDFKRPLRQTQFPISSRLISERRYWERSWFKLNLCTVYLSVSIQQVDGNNIRFRIYAPSSSTALSPFCILIPRCTLFDPIFFSLSSHFPAF